ncbi:MAG: hypothetical protein ACKVOT_09805 [Polaromonas sp.]
MDSKPVEWCLLWQNPCLPSSEWAAWAQAIFSAAAVFAAIGVVWWQLRVARKNSLAEAKFVASGLLNRINQTIAGLEWVAQELQALSAETNLPLIQFDHHLYVLGTLQLPTKDELFSLNTALPECSVSLFQASNSIRQVQTVLEVVKTRELNDATPADLLLPLHELTAAAAAQFVEARKTLDDFAPKYS